ncbi:MAG TPA: hypothetical protein VNF73_02495 [Candidatus Saccharimonadales bacterium]|nr:hypothetical protein [Candidatus Saccharimonadales bacterium]
MEPSIIALLAVVILVAVGAAAAFWGADSRPGFDEAPRPAGLR